MDYPTESRDGAETRWEPPRLSAVGQRPIRQGWVPPGLRLDIGWLIALRVVATLAAMLAVTQPNRTTALLVLAVLAGATGLVASPLFRLPLRLRTASLIETLALGLALPLAVVQAWVLLPTEVSAGQSLLLATEIGFALVLVMIAAAILVERKRALWSPLARVLALWLVLAGPTGILPGARDATTPALAVAVSIACLAGALVTLLARMVPARAASWVVISGTVVYLGLLGTNGTLERLLQNQPLGVLLWSGQALIAVALFFPQVRRWLVRSLDTVTAEYLLGRSRRGEGFAQETDRD
jgi:hypothetical protein